MKLLFLFAILCSLSYSSIITGELFNGDTFEKLNKTLVTVEDLNGNVISQKVFNEKYEVEVPTSGSYLLRAYLYKDGELEYYTEHKFQATQDKMQLDLVLIPYELYQLIPEPDKPPPLVNESAVDPGISQPGGGINIDYVVMGSIILLLAIIIYSYISSNKNRHGPMLPPQTSPKAQMEEQKPSAAENLKEENLETVEGPNTKEEQIEKTPSKELGKDEQIEDSENELHYELDEDGKKVLKILSEQEGRIMQKELREILNFSEAKMSLLLAELEVHGHVKRIKKGRDNIVKLTRST